MKRKIAFNENLFFINYDIDKLGVITNKSTGKTLKSRVATTTGYYVVGVRHDNKQIKFSLHRLLAFKYIPRIDGKDYVNHKDGNKLNISLDNLEWCTASENLKHSYDAGLHIAFAPMLGKSGIDHNLSISVIQMDKNGKELNTYGSISEAARAVSGSFGNIANCCKGRYGFKSAHGYKWKYE